MENRSDEYVPTEEECWTYVYSKTAEGRVISMEVRGTDTVASIRRRLSVANMQERYALPGTKFWCSERTVLSHTINGEGKGFASQPKKWFKLKEGIFQLLLNEI
jgi:hypothetical protein